MAANLFVTVPSTLNSKPILQKASSLAKKLSLPFYPEIALHPECSYCLLLQDSGLSLCSINKKNNKPKTILRPDFIGGKMGFRLANDLSVKLPIARAVGVKPSVRPDILDGTAGLGSDGFILAALGCKVTFCERSPVLAALLDDALLRAAEIPHLADICQRISLVSMDTRVLLEQTSKAYDTIYLDPMYPHRSKSSLNRESMRVIRLIVGDDVDAEELFDTANENAVSRVVVKRPKGAPLVSRHEPTHTIVMKNSRFDVYLKHNHKI